jgi:aspartate carbamoyltransferase regulatory subunit
MEAIVNVGDYTMKRRLVKEESSGEAEFRFPEGKTISNKMIIPLVSISHRKSSCNNSTCVTEDNTCLKTIFYTWENDKIKLHRNRIYTGHGQWEDYWYIFYYLESGT